MFMTTKWHSFFTEIVCACSSKNCDILGIAMFDSCEIRVDPTGRAIARMGTKSQGQGHETTWGQIIASEIGIPADSIAVEEGNTYTAPYGLGTYGSRSTPLEKDNTHFRRVAQEIKNGSDKSRNAFEIFGRGKAETAVC